MTYQVRIEEREGRGWFFAARLSVGRVEAFGLFQTWLEGMDWLGSVLYTHTELLDLSEKELAND